MKQRKGFVHIWLILLVLVLTIIGFAGWRIASKHKQSGKSKTSLASGSNQSHGGLLYLKSIGFHIDNYDPATNHAGDMVFTHEDHDLSDVSNEILSDFGTQDPRSPNDPTKRNPQPTFILPLGTKVLSLVDGTVANIEGLYSGDSTIMVTSDGNKYGNYIYETEHIVNPIVKIGDKVKGGQVIGEVSTHGSQYHPGFGIVEIGILHPDGNRATHICPYHYLDSSIKTDVQNKILNIHKAWMDYTGLHSLYHDDTAAEPGCSSLNPVNG
ncbi:MAG TPA: M23 family metallopeptidase [Candidatus Saccharimonadia bacterium]|nr:M23 family metallopeptidase [Candidatus Saccharimonadia bacterium]